MIRQALAIFFAVVLPSALHAQSSGADFSVFLEERVAMIPEDPAIPDEALPSLSLRADKNKDSLLVIFDCDARNLNPPEGDSPPYTLELQLSTPDGVKKFAALVRGSRSSESVDLEVAPVAGQDAISLPAGVTARQITREDGIRRVSLSIPAAAIEEAGIKDQARCQATWRQLTGYSEDGKPIYAPSGGLVLSLPGTKADLLLRSPLPTDVASMLAMLSSSTDARCEARCLRRLLWVGPRDEAVRGALVMALEHVDPAIRRAAARVWQQWPPIDTPGLPELKAKAESILTGSPP